MGYRLPVWPEAGQRAALVAPHEAGVADNVCGEDRRQFALLTVHGNCPRFLHIVGGFGRVDNEPVEQGAGKQLVGDYAGWLRSGGVRRQEKINRSQG
jgi:hypothetical protein